jgi:hypothetical protein
MPVAGFACDSRIFTYSDIHITAYICMYMPIDWFDAGVPYKKHKIK